MPFDAGDIILVPFPFTDRPIQKHRPTVVLSLRSFNEKHKHIVLAMVTSAKNAPWTSDITISNQKITGLPSPSVIRLKIFTLDERLVLSKLGELSKSDKAALKKRMDQVLG